VQLAEAILDVADAQLEHRDGLGVAHRDDPAAFDFLHLLLREPLVGPLLEGPGGRLPVLVELLLGARVFTFLEQVFGLVALAPRVCERERAILAVAVSADGVGFLAAMEAVAHPPELGGSVAGPALVRRDEEIETVTSEILAGLHAPLSNFGRAARQSTSVLICLGLAHTPSFLRATCSIPSFGIAKFAVNVCSPIPTRYQQKCQTGRSGGALGRLHDRAGRRDQGHQGFHDARWRQSQRNPVCRAILSPSPPPIFDDEKVLQNQAFPEPPAFDGGAPWHPPTLAFFNRICVRKFAFGDF